MTSTRSGIDHDAIDPTVRPQDDLYRHANGRWLATHEIPADRAMDGGFRKLHDEAEEQVRAIIEELGAAQADGSAPADANAARVGALYASFMDTETVERLGLSPIAEELAAIDAATTAQDRVAVLGALQRTGGASAVELYVDNDAKDPETYVVHLYQGGLGLPDEAYYREDQHASVRTAYLAHVARMLALGGTEQPESAAQRVLDLETRIAAHHWDVVKDRDAELTYNPMSITELAEAAPGFDWVAWAAALGAPAQAVERLVVREPSALAGFAGLWAEAEGADWTAWLRYHLLTARAPLLDETLVEANFDFYGRTLSGTPALRERWKRGVALVQGALGEAVGQVYVDRHFPSTHKARMLRLVEHLLEAYRESISTLEWMGEETRAKALEKLASFNPKIGYPDRWKSYDGLEMRADDLVGNARRSHAYETDRELGKIGRPARPRRVVHDPADGQRVLQPGHERDRLPRRDPAAALLRRRGGRRDQLRGDRCGHRPRDRPRLRRPGLEVRRGRPPGGLVDGPGPRRVREAHLRPRRSVRRLRPRPARRRPPRQRGADDRGEHRRPRRPDDRDQGLPDRPRRPAGGRTGARRPHGAPAAPARLRGLLAVQGPRRGDPAAPRHGPALTLGVPRQRHRPQRRRVLRGLRRDARTTRCTCRPRSASASGEARRAASGSAQKNV